MKNLKKPKKKQKKPRYGKRPTEGPRMVYAEDITANTSEIDTINKAAVEPKISFSACAKLFGEGEKPPDDISSRGSITKEPVKTPKPHKARCKACDSLEFFPAWAGEQIECSKCRSPIEATALYAGGAVTGDMEDHLGRRQRLRQDLGFQRASGHHPGAAADPELQGSRMERQKAIWLRKYIFLWEQHGIYERLSPFVKKVAWGGAILILGLLAASVTRYFINEPPPSPPPPYVEPPSARMVFEQSLPEKYQDSEFALRQFLAADSVEELLKWVRDRERVEPAIRAWYGQNRPHTSKLTAVRQHSAAKAGGIVFVRALAETQDHRVVAVNLEETTLGWKADWESFVAWGEMHWPQLASELKPGMDPVLVRGYLQFSDHYVAGYTAQAHQSCRLTSPDRSVELYTWLERDENALRTLRGALFDAEKSEIEVVLRLKASLTVPGELEVAEILQTGWVLWPGARPGGFSLYAGSRQ